VPVVCRPACRSICRFPRRKPPTADREVGLSSAAGGLLLPRSSIATGDALPSGGDVPRSPWPSQGVV
jgi:hypothetical protein